MTVPRLFPWKNQARDVDTLTLPYIFFIGPTREDGVLGKIILFLKKRNSTEARLPLLPGKSLRSAEGNGPGLNIPLDKA
jgi:hypothetical protein